MLEENKNEDSEMLDKSDDKKAIEEEERKKMIGGEEISRSEVERKKKVLEQAVEGAARRRAPTGGIRVPGFLRVSRSRDRNKEGEGDGEEASDLLESPSNETKSPEDQTTPQGQQAGLNNNPLLSKIKSVPFMKKKKNADDHDDEKQPTPAEDQVEENQPKKPKQLINAIKLPLAFIPNKLKAKEGDELGTQAGLASMETLDDSNGSKHEDKMETVKLDNVDLDPEKAALETESDSRWAKNSWMQYMQLMKEYKFAVGGICVFIVLLLILVIYVVVSPKAPVHAPIEQGRYIKAVTSCGHVEGVLEGHIFIFRGIPYAKPPVGQLRFAPPQALTLQDCWNSTFNAHNTTQSCWQMFPNGTIDGTEDCLTIDIYTPQVRYDSPLPVVVALGVAELGIEPSIVKTKDTVVVIPRVRQGPLGFTATHHLSVATYPYSSGNYGLADLVAALKWIQLNIEHFGGDKKQVTVLGWRQGATLATALTVVQKPELLFRRLWLSSGSAVFPNKTLVDSESDSEEYIRALPCPSAPSADCLRKLDVEDLLDAVPDSWRPVARGSLPTGEENRHQWLVRDGDLIRESPYAVWEVAKEAGETPKIDVIIGTTVHSEINEAWKEARSSYTAEDIRKEIEASIIGRMNLTDKVLGLYNNTLSGLAEIVSDIATVCPLYFLSQKIPGARFYLMGHYDEDILVYGGKDIEAIFGWVYTVRPQARRAGGALLQLFHKYSALGELPQYKATLIQQDPSSLREGLPRCQFWKQAGFSDYAWID